MKPAVPEKPKPVPAGKPAIPGIEQGDHVYARHATRGPIAVRVDATGKHGLVGTCDRGERHKVLWEDVLGHKQRVLQQYKVADRGADGAILEAPDGRRRFVAGEVPELEQPAEGPLRSSPAETATKDDPLLGGMSRLSKGMGELKMQPTLILMKASVKNRPGLALQDVTDKSGSRTKRWKKTGAAAPAAPHHAPLQHGQTVAFRHGDVGHEGKITGSGADGVTVKDKHGVEHQVKHEHLVVPGKPEPGAEAGDTPKPPNQPMQSSLFPPETVSSLPEKASQPVSDEAELFSKSAEALDQLKDWLDKGKGICSQLGMETASKGIGDTDMSKPGGVLFIAPLKGAARAREKVKADYKGDWSQLKDTVRCTICVDKASDMDGLVAALNKGGMKLAQWPKDRITNPTPVGYRDVLLNVTMPNGIIGEVQLNTKAMLAAKGDGHHHYEIERTMDAKEKGGTALSAEETQSRTAAIDAQKQIYGAAWSKASGAGDAPAAAAPGAPAGAPAKGGEQPMKKAMEMGEGAARAGAGREAAAAGAAPDAGGGAASYFEHEGAQYRRKAGAGYRSVDDILTDGKWTPYEGSDALEPALFGDEIEDPTAGAGDDDAGGGDEGGGDEGAGGAGDAPLAKSVLFVFTKKE